METTKGESGWMVLSLRGRLGDVSNGLQEPWKEQGTPKALRAGQPQGEAEGL